MDVFGKVAIVTGASAGIGEATARAFTEAGAKLVLVARSGDKLTGLAGELSKKGREALCLPADVRDQAAVSQMVERAFEHYGRVDILINNAGQAVAGTVADVNVEDFRQVVDLNVFGPLYAMQAVVPKMRQGGGGVIINISSMVSKLQLPGLGAYAATKSALNMLSDTARVELAQDDIRVITVYPRTTATDFGRHSLGNQWMREEQRAQAPRGGQPVDSAEYVAGRILAAAQSEPDEQYMED